MAATIRFADFLIDPDRHELRRDGRLVPIKPRYFDLLLLLASNPGTTLSKEQLFDAVWGGTVVGDEALTQAIKEIRRALGDEAGAPRFIETVPRRGYRFIGPLAEDRADDGAEELSGGVGGAGGEAARAGPRRRAMLMAGIGGGAAAGLTGGIAYGLIAGIGNDSAKIILLVMASLSAAMGALGAFGIVAGMAVVSRLAGRGWLFSAVGAGVGGFLVGDAFHLVASGGFSLLTGTAHEAFAGGFEGVVLGAGIAIGATLGGGVERRGRGPVLGGALGGLLAGAMIALLGGRLMAASLAALARRFHGANLELGPFGALAGVDGPPTLLPALVAGGEGLLLGAALVAALCWRWRRGG